MFMKKILLFVLIIISTMFMFSCENESEQDDLITEEAELTFEDQKTKEAEEARRESAERYITMSPQQYETFFRNTREGIRVAIESSDKRRKEYETTIADFKAKRNDVSENDNLIATNKLKGEKDRNKRLKERLVMYDEKIKGFENVEPNDRPQFIEELKVILKH